MAEIVQTDGAVHAEYRPFLALGLGGVRRPGHYRLSVYLALHVFVDPQDQEILPRARGSPPLRDRLGPAILYPGTFRHGFCWRPEFGLRRLHLLRFARHLRLSVSRDG